MTPDSKQRKPENAKEAWTSQKLDWINSIVADPDRLTDFQARVGVGLSSYFNAETGECYVKQKTLAKRVGGGRRATQNALDRLVETGYLDEPQVGMGPGGTNIYKMTTPEHAQMRASPANPDAHPAHVDAQFETEGAHLDAPPLRTQMRTPCAPPFAHEHLCFDTSASTPVQDIYLPSISGEDSIAGNAIIKTAEIQPPDGGFSEFWEAFPFKVGKAGAHRKFHAIMKEGKVTAAEIIAGAKYYAEYQAVKDPKGQYTKHPETWLNKGCWPDRPPIPDRSQTGQRTSTAEQVQAGIMNNLRRRGLA